MTGRAAVIGREQWTEGKSCVQVLYSLRTFVILLGVDCRLQSVLVVFTVDERGSCGSCTQYV